MLAILQFDAANVALLERLMGEGRLPCLAELRGRGRWYDLESPATHFAGSTYHTIYSGQEVGTHGMYFAFQWSAAEQRVRWLGARPGVEGVWERLSRTGGRSLVIDPYEIGPPRALDGTWVSGWQFTNRAALHCTSLPEGARRSLARVHGRPPGVDEVFGRPTVAMLRRLRRQLLSASGRVADAALDRLEKERFDLVWLTFLAPHIGGHQLWDLSQLPDGRLDEAGRRELGEALADIYATVDNAIARILATLPDDADVIVVSPLGMDVNTSRSDLLPGMLAAVLDGNERPRSEHGDLIWRLRGTIPTPIRRGIARALPGRVALELAARLDLRGVDWSRTRAFAVPGDHHGFVRLNVRGREHDGIVDPDEAEAVIDEIAAGLRSFRDMDGSPAVAAVERTSEVIEDGPGVQQLPDLIVRWSDQPATRLTGVRSPRFGDVVRRGGGTGRSGGHSDQAWAVVVPGHAVHSETGPSHDVVDIAATACALLGADETGLAGRPLLQHAA